MTIPLNWPPVVKLIGKLQDGTVFLKKGHDGENEDDLFEFKTDEGMHPDYFIVIIIWCFSWLSVIPYLIALTADLP